MTTTITALDAGHGLEQRLREVEAGEDFVIRRDGVPIARLVPMAPAPARSGPTPEQVAAMARLRAWAPEKWDVGAGPLNRDELHER